MRPCINSNPGEGIASSFQNKTNSITLIEVCNFSKAILKCVDRGLHVIFEISEYDTEGHLILSSRLTKRLLAASRQPGSTSSSNANACWF